MLYVMGIGYGSMGPSVAVIRPGLPQDYIPVGDT